MKNRINTTKAKSNGKAKLVTISEPKKGPSFLPCRITLHLSRGVVRKIEKFVEQDGAAQLADAIDNLIFSTVKDTELTARDYRSIAADIRREERKAKRRGTLNSSAS